MGVPVRKLTPARPISVRFMKRLLEETITPVIELPIDGKKIKLEFRREEGYVEFEGEVENLFGGTEETPVPYKTRYGCLVATVKDVYANVRNRKKKLFICFECYGTSEFFDYPSFGIEIGEEDISLKRITSI